MATELLGKANDEFVNENYEKATQLYAEALELEKRDDIYCNRAQAYIKLEKYKEAVDDCNQAISLNPNNCKAHLRKGTSLFHLEDYKSAKDAFTQGQTLDPADGNFRTWIRKCEAEMDLLKQEKSDTSEVKIGSSGGDSKTEDSKTGAKTEQSTEPPKTVPMPPKEKSRYDWYQTQTHVIVTILLKNVKQEDMTIDIQERSLSACIKLPSGSDYTLELDLSHPVDPKQSLTKLLKSKIEVKLKKCEEIQWQKLEGAEPQKLSRIKVESDPKQYPSSSHYTRNWDKLAQEVAEEEKEEKKEGDGALNDLFQKIYADGTDETKKAMMKSFYESGGTVLSTNWGEVGKDKVEVKPPDGMEFRKWES